MRCTKYCLDIEKTMTQSLQLQIPGQVAALLQSLLIVVSAVHLSGPLTTSAYITAVCRLSVRFNIGSI